MFAKWRVYVCFWADRDIRQKHIYTLLWVKELKNWEHNFSFILSALALSLFKSIISTISNMQAMLFQSNEILGIKVWLYIWGGYYIVIILLFYILLLEWRWYKKMWKKSEDKK